MWRKVPKYRLTPTLAPPTPTAAVDGSRYFPPRVEQAGRAKPGVPERARIKSARRVMGALEERRVQGMSPQIKSNPLIHVAALIERLPVVQPPLKSWQVDFAAVQMRAMDEIERKIPPSIIKQQWEENPPWSVEAFKDYFGKHAESLTPLISPPKESDLAAAALKQEADNAAAATAKKQQKQGKKGTAKESAKKQESGKGEAKPAEAKPAEGGAAAAKPAETGGGWEKAMADLGIEFAETTVDEDASKAMTLHVDLKTKKDDRLVDFAVVPRVTEADKRNDTKSLDRKLWHKLYLVVKRKGKWGFPSVQRASDKEGLMEAARRAAFSVFDEETRTPDLYFVSACPAGYRPLQSAKEFFLKVQLLHGGGFDRGTCKETVEDFAWLTPKEIAELFYGKDSSKDEYQYVVRMFGDDWWEDPRDSNELSPREDDLANMPLKKLSEGVIKKRVREEEERRAALEEKVVAGQQQLAPTPPSSPA
jgi:hypothetical protein